MFCLLFSLCCVQLSPASGLVPVQRQRFKCRLAWCSASPKTRACVSFAWLERLRVVVREDCCSDLQSGGVVCWRPPCLGRRGQPVRVRFHGVVPVFHRQFRHHHSEHRHCWVELRSHSSVQLDRDYFRDCQPARTALEQHNLVHRQRPECERSAVLQVTAIGVPRVG